MMRGCRRSSPGPNPSASYSASRERHRCSTARQDRTIPFGSPVVPEENSRSAGSSHVGDCRSARSMLEVGSTATAPEMPRSRIEPLR